MNMNMNRKKANVLLKQIEIEKESKRLSDCLAACHAQRNRLVQANMELRKEVEERRVIAQLNDGNWERVAARKDELDKEVKKLQQENEELHKNLNLMKAYQMSQSYKIGMPLGEEERGQWRNRLHDSLARVGTWKDRTERRDRVIRDLRQRLADMRDLIPQGFGRPEVQEKADAIIEGANLRRVCPVDTETNPNPGGEPRKPFSSGPQFGGALANYLIQAQAAERAAEQDAKMRKAVSEEVTKQIEEKKPWTPPVMLFHKDIFKQGQNAGAKKFIEEVAAFKLSKGVPKKKPLTKKKRK